MSDVIPRSLRSNWPTLAASFACFAVAGIANGGAAGLAATIGTTGVAVVGVYLAARFVTTISRPELARLSFALWVAFLAVAGLYAIGPDAVIAAVPGPSEALSLSLTAITWGTLFSAASTTVFLGFRELGSASTSEIPEEQILDGESSDYSTR
ncbi:hypothetical protein EA462_08820 [Natrarchaeobius halalkaliphilus]|uniref:Uncharacterized protein n=1 Tax=Natrarchaeobius halalkaliphilus TaxID=1679091 RepID=A0A3N6M4D6_9EURY|nr:hypothetical protein [Natrarchaeobius halalkaliphilus]RQG90091.1 hypothetical protein EA462_08820 [Natrarchaeobius halalkaliphilus]